MEREPEGFMEKLEGKINPWLRDQMIPRLASIFGEKCNSNDVEYKVTEPKGSFYLSSLFFVKIKFPTRERNVLVKLPSQDPVTRTYQNYDRLFSNEMLFYDKIAVHEAADFPRCYYVNKNDPVFENVIVLEDLTVQGFSPSTKKVNVPLDYIVAGLKSIARFHGNTYAMKIQKPEKFQRIVKSIIPLRYNETVATEQFIESMQVRLRRVSKTLRSSSYDQIFVEKVTKLFENVYSNIVNCIQPVEPLATIVHGDCTINNILFQKQNNSVKSVLIDFALLMYTSPAIDTSTFIYMCCSREDIKMHYAELLKVYHDTLAEYMKERCVWDPIKYSYDVLLRDYKQRAIFGYVIAAYFLPMMTEYELDNDILQLPTEKVKEINLTGGGEALSNLLIDMLIDMREDGLLDCWVT